MCFSGALLAHTYKPLINPFSDGYNGLSHSPNALQQPHSDKAYIYNHTCMDALYMYVYVHYNIYVYIHRYTFYGFIHVLYTCFHISLYIYAVFFSVYVWVCVCEPVLYVRMKAWCGSECETYLTRKKRKENSLINSGSITLFSCHHLCNFCLI